MSKWLGDLSQKTFKSAYKSTVVTEVEYYDKYLKRIRYQGDDLKPVDWKPSQEVEFRVTDTEYRHYTPLCWNNIEGYTDVLFYLHGKGPGSLWAERIEVGEEILLIGPGGKFVMPPEADHVVMMGDETTLSAFKGMSDRLPHSIHKTCVLELGETSLQWAVKIGLSATVLETLSAERGLIQEIWLEDYLHENQEKNTYFLSGNANTIKKLRNLLIKAKVPPKQIFSKPYWMEGREGL